MATKVKWLKSGEDGGGTIMEDREFFRDDILGGDWDEMVIRNQKLYFKKDDSESDPLCYLDGVSYSFRDQKPLNKEWVWKLLLGNI